MPGAQPATKTPPKAIPAVGAKKKRKYRVSNQVTLDPNNPVPFDYSGQSFSYVHNERYLPFLPTDHDFAQKLLEVRLLSTTHNACVTTKRDFVAGNGFQDENNKPLPEEMTTWFEALNRKGQDLLAINQGILESHLTFGNTPIEIVRTKVLGKPRLYIYVHSFLDWRLCLPDDDGVVGFALMSKLFRRNIAMTPEQIKEAKKLPIYNPMQPEKKNWLVDDKGVERTLIWLTNPMAGFDHYGMPSALASMIFQILEYKGARYDLDNFENNMIVSAILALKGNLDPNEVTRIAKQIIDTHTGDGKRGRVAVVSSEDGIDGSDFHQMETSKEGSYIQSDDKWTQKIILANEWDAILAGIISPSTMGKGSGFITKIIELKTRTVIKPMQRTLINKVWKTIFKIAEKHLGIPFSQFTLQIKNEIDISGLTDVDITPAVQVNEVRVAKGLPEDPTMKGVYMKAAAVAQPAPDSGGGNQNV
jgi:hypothetical protein